MISRFSDIQPGTPGGRARFYIEECAERLPVIVGGYENNAYRPTGVVDRAAMAVFMSRALKLRLGTYQGLFADVPSTYWAALQIEALATAGIVSGFSDHTYRPSGCDPRCDGGIRVARHGGRRRERTARSGDGHFRGCPYESLGLQVRGVCGGPRGGGRL